jgi:hypothetical protein
MAQKKCQLLVELSYDGDKTDPEGLATLLDTVVSTGLGATYEDCLSRHGSPKVGAFLPMSRGNLRLQVQVVDEAEDGCDRPLTVAVEGGQHGVYLTALNSLGQPLGSAGLDFYGNRLAALVEVGWDVEPVSIAITEDVAASLDRDQRRPDER